ncbi:NACHT, LRR and PYD domains-containing protein 6-like isoform X3 [Hydra vulgaris]
MHKFVDLCMVDAVNTQTDAVFSVEREEFLKKQLRYTPIPYSEIFRKEKSVTLISGIAGIGKTWLLRKCLLDWSNGLIWENVKLVFYLECRRLNLCQNIGNINELVNYFYEDIINDFDINIHPALFIIDGLDEFKYLNELINYNSNCNYPIVNALTEIQKYKYVVAGRVYAIDKYQSITTEHCDKINIQIMGFNESGINNYIENNVLEEKKDVVKATLKESAIAKSMSSVPFYLSSMCKIISNSKNLCKSSFLTMTDLYANIFLYFLQKHIIKNNELIYQLMENNFNKKYILNICKIAYQLFIENRVIFSKEDIQTFIIDNFDRNEENFFGFIERIETNLGYLYQFAHLTIMEFCASVYAYNCLSSEEIITNEKLKSCLSMICGLTNKNQSSLLKFLVNLNPLKETCEESLSLFFIFDEVVLQVPIEEIMILGADFNGHVGEGNSDDEEVMGRYGVNEKNTEGQMVVHFAKRIKMAVINTYFKKKEEHSVTYKSGGRGTQVDNILYRRRNLKEVSDCKVVPGESVAKQHRMVIGKMVLEVKKKKRVRAEPKIKWWKLKDEDCCVKFRDEVRQALSGGVLDTWKGMSNTVRDVARKILGVTSRQKKIDKETWWWNEEVQESLRGKQLAKKNWHFQQDEESRQKYKEMCGKTKRAVAKLKKMQICMRS